MIVDMESALVSESDETGALILEVEEDGSNVNRASSLATGENMSLASVDAQLGFGSVDLGSQIITSEIYSSVELATTSQGTSVDSMGMVSGHFVADAATLRNLIASGAVQLTDVNGLPIDISGTDTTQVFHMLGSIGSTGPEEAQPSTSTVKEEQNIGSSGDAPMQPPAQYKLPPLPTSVPPGTPAWAARLRDCEKIGDYYRGWVENDIELDLLLTYHKQQTQSTWGTRQSPCPSKQATRLMWKSQYAPFDGIPFINAGSRAIVMECQFGPRRKGTQARKEVSPLHHSFKKTCPARIYVKKVKKFIEYAVDIVNDKKAMKVEMDRAFQLLKECEFKAYVQERYYVQLPTDKAHENHVLAENAESSASTVSTATSLLASSPNLPAIVKPKIPSTQSFTLIKTDSPICSRLHPLVQDKIRSLVANGETRLYAIRKQIRKYVEKEMFEAVENVPERHNLTYFPTVHDLQNHIHQALLDIENGTLQVNPQNVTLEVRGQGLSSDQDAINAANLLQGDHPHAQTVTVTLTHAPTDGDEKHMISKVETELSDGSTHVSNNLNAEMARLLEKLHPNMFPLNSLLQHVSLAEGQQTSVRLDVPEESAESMLLAAAATASDQPAVAPINLTTNPPSIEAMVLPTPASLNISTQDEESPSSSFDGDNTQAKQDAGQVARIIAASSDQSGYALVQTETGALLLAKESELGGYHILGQAGATFAPTVVGARSPQKDSDVGSLALNYSISVDQSHAAIDNETFASIQPNSAIQLGTGLDAGDATSVLSSTYNLNPVKSEDGGGDHR